MNNRRLPIIIVTVIAVIVLMAVSSSLFFTVSATERAILFRPFGDGLDKDDVLQPGYHMKAPWNDAITFEISEQSNAETMDINDKSGLPIHVDVTIRYHPDPTKIGYLYEKFKNDYIENLVVPEMRSLTRQVMARYTAEEIWSTKRAEVEGVIISETEKVLSANYVTTSAVLIRSITLPEQIRTAIQNKLQQEQEALAYQFRLDKEKSEAERKRIAAEGESKANNIINNSLSDKLLKMRGIEATLELSKSPNSKVVIIGSGKDGLPMILGNN
jgi:regulator of protease activity HflC (stomatin/prohibitin superfamily)